ncbi:AraC family transcriptional regulator [Gaoshiqia sp. Z1-71]|uniref:AraC family transcriptional regulator n=1 Tax=Gaoshiqia hydrogeniformans TaxID=3290090 RepID=UPI003BF79F97
MFNLYEDSLTANYRRLECDGLLFVEYQCLSDSREIYDLWSPYAHLVYVTSGNKTWITPDGEFPASPGDAVYCKKGACIMRNSYETDFCALIFFFPKDFIREVVLEYQVNLKNNESEEQNNFQILRMNVDANLRLFFESVSTYFLQNAVPSKHLLKLKFKELLLQILTTNYNPLLKAYFLSTLSETRENIESVMRKNLLFNLSMEAYARLCNRSLSSFKRDFKKAFGIPPLQWIMEERLKYARSRLLATEEHINDIAFYSGFESTPHFIRCFKKHFGLPPLQFRLQSEKSEN